MGRARWWFFLQRLLAPRRRIRLSGRRATVYVFQDRSDPCLVKVGYTARLCKRRNSEVARASAPLRQIMALDMAHARSVETLAHRRLRKRFRGHPRGREWYVVDGAGALANLLRMVQEAALTVRSSAKARGAWRGEDDRRARRWLLTDDGPRITGMHGE